MRDVTQAPKIEFFIPPMPNGRSHHVISRGQSPKFYRPEDLKDKGAGRTPWVTAFEEMVIGLHLALDGPVPYAFRTPDGTLRSLDGGCVRMLLNRTPAELIPMLGTDGYIRAVIPSPELLARYAGCQEELRRRVIQATSEMRLSSTPAFSLSGSVAVHSSGSAAAPISNDLQFWTSDLNIERALIIREPWISKILSGDKTWEMRSRPTSVRGWIGLAAHGSNQIVGLARLVDCELPLTARNYDAHFDKHGIPADQTQWAIENGWVFPWVLSDVIRLPQPVSVPSRPGTAQFLPIDPRFAEEVSALALAAGQPPASLPAAGVPARVVQADQAGPNVHAGAESGDQPVFVFAPQKAKARGVHTGAKRFKVLKGSTAMRSGSPKVRRDEAFRDRLVREGVLVPSTDADLYEFSRDHEFDSASRAAGIVKDGNASGPQQWIHPESRKTLKDYLDSGGRL